MCSSDLTQYRLACRVMPTGRNPFPQPPGDCGDDCSVSIELGIPCWHRIYTKLACAEPFTKWEVHPRWRLREASQNIYRRILDPKIATALRGRPTNTAQPIPSQLAIGTSNIASPPLVRHLDNQVGSAQGGGRSLGSRAVAAPALGARRTSLQQGQSAYRQTRSKSAVLMYGKTTGVRASGHKTQPSIRRTRSQWELLSSDEEILPEIVVSATAGK